MAGRMRSPVWARTAFRRTRSVGSLDGLARVVVRNQRSPRRSVVVDTSMATFWERTQGAVVFLLDTPPVEVLGDQFLALAEFQADEMDGREAGGVLHLEGRGHGILGAIEGGGLFPFHGAIGIEDLHAGGERGRGAGAVVDYFDVVAGGVPLDVQGLGALLSAEVGGGGLEVIVVSLPD